VARYAGGAGNWKYPWGESLPPPKGAGNFADRSARGLVTNVLAGYDDGWPTTAPVGQFTPNAIGLYDLGGNVAEWVNDFYTVWPAGGPEVVDPMGPADGQYHVIRGSGWRHASISELRLSYRDFGDAGRLDVGFRVARYPEMAEGT
jgi:formylglycine-generating enzyme required for sulfatase activity